MDKSELARLKELAEKATPGPWYIKETDSFGKRMEGKRILESYADKCEHFILAYEDEPYNKTAFIAAANPQTVLALITEIERLEKEIKEYESAESNLTVCYFAGRMAEGRERNAKEDQLLAEIKRLNKEADWLAEKLAGDGTLLIDVPCGMNCNPCDYSCRHDNWREAARKAVEAGNE